MRLVRAEGEGGLEEQAVDQRAARWRHRLVPGHELRELTREPFEIHGAGIQGPTLVLRLLEEVVARANEGALTGLPPSVEVRAGVATRRTGVAEGCGGASGAAVHAGNSRVALVELAHDLALQQERLVDPPLERAPAVGEVGAKHRLARQRGIHAIGEQRAVRLRERLLALPGHGRKGNLEIGRLAEVDVVAESGRVPEAAKRLVDGLEW